MEDSPPERAEALARAVARGHGEVAAVRRFPTGLCHYVFDVDLTDGSRVVVRVADPANRHLLVGAVAWSGRLRPLGVPLPAVLAHDLGPRSPMPYVVLERLPGDDLGVVYATLTPDRRREVARSVVTVQEAVRGLGEGAGYGYSAHPDARPPRDTWVEVLLDNLRRSGGRLRSSSPDVRRLHGRVVDRVADSRTHLDGVPAVPFLDDATTKNVLVHGGALSGVVDVDVVCFGDPLYTPALTKVSLVAAGLSTDYVDAWLQLVAPGPAELDAFDVYSAVFCLDLLSEAGVLFNRGRPEAQDEPRTRRLVALAASVL